MQNTITKDETNQLIFDCGNGDPAALKRFFEIYSVDIYNFPMKVFHLSEDDASDFYIYAFERLKSGKRLKNFEGKSRFRTWLFSVLRNLLIDWKRTQKDVELAPLTKTNQDGEDYGGIEEEADSLTEKKAIASEFSNVFHQGLQSLKLENRVLFKLTFIYYLQLEEDEILYIMDKSAMTLDELKEWIIQMREELSNKESDIQKMEDKITALYLNILELKKSKIQEDSGQDPKTNLPDCDRIGKSLDKKYEQRKKLLERKQKGHFLARTPFKDVAKVMGLTEGGVSVSIIRTIEKLQKNINFDEF
ncbi:MAG: RNA polymerase sigma factor [Leptospira sp.]|nr:RNA polymerase sigma factor [Leptospira sp.]